MRPLQADGLRLEPLVAEHAAAMFELLADPRIYEYENAPPVSVESLRERYKRLEARRSPDGHELWLNWAVREPTGALIGCVQATVFAGGHAIVAYEFASAYWGRGVARRAVEAMIAELAGPYQVHSLSAVLKAVNQRSRQLLLRLGFEQPQPAATLDAGLEPDEILMRRALELE